MAPATCALGTTGGIADVNQGAGADHQQITAANPKETMNPQLAFAITQKRHAELVRPPRIRRPSGSLRRYVTGRFAGATRYTVSLGEGGQLQ